MVEFLLLWLFASIFLGLFLGECANVLKGIR